jgi:putative hemolysin
MLADLFLLLVLILLNGVFAMSELAILGSRRVRLLQMAERGSAGAATALAVAEEPTRFLSTVQVGITSIGIMSGAVGEATLAARLQGLFEQWPLLAPYADSVAFVVMVVALTYASLIAGELVPKRLALTRPEGIAAVVARPMRLLSAAARPVVFLLSATTDGILRLLRVSTHKGPAVTVEEFKVLVEQGAAEGVLEKIEQELLGNVLRLDERRAGAIMTPRADIVFLDATAPIEASRRVLAEHPHTVVPLCEGDLDHVSGFVRSTDVLRPLLRGETLDLRRIAVPPLFVPPTMTVMRLLEQFRRAHVPVALVIDEHGAVEGLISLADVVAAIVGEVSSPDGDPMIVERPDGSWLLDGALDLAEVRRLLRDDDFAQDAAGYYHTLGGLTMYALGRIPRTGDTFEKEGVAFEVIDMDGNRVDKILARRIVASSTDAS